MNTLLYCELLGMKVKCVKEINMAELYAGFSSGFLCKCIYIDGYIDMVMAEQMFKIIDNDNYYYLTNRIVVCDE